ncbi:hypothetical protein [Arthrobacter wenxiniae]|uniref:hypothetical protein n=1 Tax=Arthrobacter wenxiniae TaxID=2713570 RepID=UPI001C400A39|nr:hypothetical protein [Arthrobacter wenxiniae]
MKYSAPTQAFKTVPSSLGAQWPTTTPAGGGIRAAAALLNAGTKVALPVGSWAGTSSPTISAA